jgi:2-dehydropantoate 2-reductase
MRFLVLGAGALGGYFGGLLLQGGAEVAFVVRPRRAAQLAKSGLVVKTPAGDIKCPVNTLLAGEIDGHYDVVLLACKAYDLDSAIEAIAPALGTGSAVLPILNGIRHLDMLGARLGQEHVLGGVGLVNAELSPEGVIEFRLAAAEHLVFGELTGESSARCREIHRAFAAGGVPSRASGHIIAEMWAKFCGYAAVATIAILTRARAGEIAATVAGDGFVAAVFNECTRLVTREGYEAPAEMLDTFSKLYAQIGSSYRPSVAVDLEAGRQTEGEHTIGDLVRRADQCGLEVPLLRAALCNLQVHEARVRQRA